MLRGSLARRPRWPGVRLWVPVVLVAALGSGCATSPDARRTMEGSLAAGHPDQALALLEKERRRKRDAVLYYLNKGMLLCLNGEFEQSNAVLERAKLEMERLYGVSVSEQTGAVIINEKVIRYKGDPYEQVLLHAFKMLNYLALDKPDAARVEALQVDLKMRTQGGDAFVENGLTRYLSGIVFESLGELDSAYIDYRKAYEFYRNNSLGLLVPPSLQQDLLRLAEAQGRSDDLREYLEVFELRAWPFQQTYHSQGELVVLFHTELAPEKQERIISTYAPNVNVFVNIAVPYYVDSVSRVKRVRLRVGEQELALPLVEDVAAESRRALERRMPAITARAAARVALKTVAAAEAQEQNEWVGVLVNLAGLITERADTRSWTTLPREVRLGRILLPPGEYTVQFEVIDRHGVSIDTVRHQVALEAGRKTFLSSHWFAPVAGGGRK